MIEFEDITVNFGGVVALDSVSATLQAPVSGIIGPNGAGKTTLMNVISGFLRCTGRISCQGDSIEHLAPHRRARWGLRRSFQREQIANDLSVADNLRVVLDPLPGTASEKRADIDHALEATGLIAKADTAAVWLNSFERRLLDTARCLVGKPRMILFDEPSSGFTQDETRHLGALILKINALTGAMTIIIDHDVDLITEVCSEILVLDFGKRVSLGETGAVLNDPRVKAAYLGMEEVEQCHSR